MQLRIASVGQRMPGWVADGWAEYARRMPPELSMDLKEVPLQKRGRNADINRLRKAEGSALLSSVGPGFRIVALDVQGKQYSTEQLAKRLEFWMSDGRNCGFLIGGPDGLDESCLQAADEKWSLGPLTMPHPLVRVVLAEQLYRAWTITRNHPYHRA